MSFKQNQRFYQSSVQPINPNPGDEWFNTTTNRNYQFLSLSGNAPTWVETAIAPVANTFSLPNLVVNGTGTFTGSSSSLALNPTNVVENVSLNSTAASAILNYNVTSQTVMLITAAATTNFIVNIRGSDALKLNSLLSIGQSISLVLMVTNSASAYYVSGVQVDGSTVTAKWLGGTAPTTGNSGAIDSYTFSVIKTADSTFTVLGSSTKFA